MSQKDCCYGSPSCLWRDVSAASIVHKLLSLVNQPADCEERNEPRRALSLWTQMKAICSIIYDWALFSDNVRCCITFLLSFHLSISFPARQRRRLSQREHRVLDIRMFFFCDLIKLLCMTLPFFLAVLGPRSCLVLFRLCSAEYSRAP